LTALLQQPDADAAALAAQLNLMQENDTSSIEAWVTTAIAAMPDKVKEYRSGKKALLGLFAGQVKKLSHGKADMQQVNLILEKFLNQ
jgi:aspartyl-tRNA(Asn)/glutamyl-tRNA(Gln) amidotransferase subunit B